MPRVAIVRRDPQFSYLCCLAEGRPIFTADYYTVDGVSGKVAAFVDWNDVSHLLVQASSSNQVAIPAAHADFANKLCATFTGAQWYLSNRSAAYWIYGNNGTPFAFYTVATHTSVAAPAYLLSTRAATGRGFNQFFDTTAGGRVGTQVLGPSATVSTTRPYTVANVPFQLRFRYTEGAGPPEWAFKITGQTETTGSSSNAPVALAPDTTLRVGSYDGTQLFFVGRLASLSFVLDGGASRDSAMQNALQQLYGIPP